MSVIACTGGRDFTDKNFVYQIMDYACGYYNIHKIIVGDAKGVDMLVCEWCLEALMPHEIFVADWKIHGRAAGPIRNQAMLDCHPEYLLAFPGGIGTNGCVKLAKRMWIPIIDHRYD